jgi:hypothetical protein
VSRIWQDALSILETACVQNDSQPSEFGIVVDDRNGLRIVNGTGWQLEALRTEYQATTAFLVKRTANFIVVQAQSASERCDLRRTTGKRIPESLTAGVVAHHLIRREQLSIAASDQAEQVPYPSARY